MGKINQFGKATPDRKKSGLPVSCVLFFYLISSHQTTCAMKMTDLLGLFNQGSASAKSHMKNLIEIAAVDGQFLDLEYDLLKSIAKRNGISEGKLKEIKSNPGGIEFDVPADPKVKFQQLFDLVHMMSVDKSVHAEELKLCNLFAIKFGYKREIVGELVNTIRGNIQNGQSVGETMKRVQMMLG